MSRSSDPHGIPQLAWSPPGEKANRGREFSHSPFHRLELYELLNCVLSLSLSLLLLSLPPSPELRFFASVVDQMSRCFPSVMGRGSSPRNKLSPPSAAVRFLGGHRDPERQETLARHP